MMFEEWQGAVVYIGQNGSDIAVSAAHVFQTPDGFAFVCPGHLYQETAHLNNFHRYAATLKPKGNVIEFDGPDGSGYIEEWEAGIEQQKEAGTSLNDYENQLQALGKTYAEERADILAILSDELAKPIDQE